MINKNCETRGRLCVPRTPSPSLSSTFPEDDLDITVPTRASMIACCGPRTRLPDARSRTELAGAARPLRRRQGRRDPDASTRGRGTATHQPSAGPDVARPRRAQRAEQTAARRIAPGAAGLTPNPAALAPPARRPPLDLPAPTTRPTTHRTPDPGPGAADGPRESPVGLQKNSRRVGRPRPPRRRLNRLDDPEERRTRSRAPTGRSDLATVPVRRPTRSSPSTSPTSTPSSCAASTSSS
jgi:hypothetical protein